jgi:hypothetical protein
MNKLDKIPPKEIKPLKDNPIAQGIISNAIFQVLWNGISALIAWIIVHYALIGGVPLFFAIFLAVVAFFLLALSYNLIMRRRDARALKDAKDERLEVASTTQLQPATEKHELTFEIDQSGSQVRVGGGSVVRRITAEIKLRCIKKTDNLRTVRAFHIALLKSEANGETTVIPLEDGQSITDLQTLGVVSDADGWMIDKPLSTPRCYRFFIEITKEIESSLSRDHFLRVTMDAVGQVPVRQDLFVENWTELSPITLKRREEFSFVAQKEINKLKAELGSYEQTNERLGRFIEEHKALIDVAREQKAEIDNWVKIKGCERGDLTLQPVELTAHPKVMLSIWITNTSALNVAISNSLDGVIEFEGSELRESKKVVNPITNLETGETQCLTIEQRLSDSDVSMLRKAEHSTRALYFNFDKLKVTIIGGKRSPDLPATILRIEEHNKAVAFPVSPHERLQRVRAFSEIRGRCVQLHEPLRIGNEPLPKQVIEYWRDGALDTLRHVYKDEGAERLWREITHGEPIPESASFQRGWLSGCIVMLGAMLEEEAGQYIRSTQNALANNMSR